MTRFSGNRRHSGESNKVDNRALAHRFFYQDEKSRGEYAHLTVSFDKDTFRSYRTAVGRLVKDKNTGKPLLLYSKDSLSTTTSKHISVLIQACPHERLAVPQHYGNHYLSFAQIYEDCIKQMGYYMDNPHELSKADNRRKVISAYSTLKNCITRVEGFEIVATTIDPKYKDMYERLYNPEEVKKLQSEQRKKQATANKEAKKQLAELMATKSYSEIAKIAFDYWYDSGFDRSQRAKIEKTINPDKKYSIAYFDGGVLKTSQNIAMPYDEAIRLLQIYKAGKGKHGEKVMERYTVQAVYENGDVKIGCHLISRHNLEELMKEAKLTD